MSSDVFGPVGATPRHESDKRPDWYPDRINPNVQSYWDGTAWTSQRRWVNGTWIDETPPAAVIPGAASITDSTYTPARSFAPSAPTAPGSRPLPPYSAAYTQTNRRPVVMSPVTGGMAGLLFCSLLLILGSLTPWISVSLGSLSTSISGTDSGISALIGVNGWITFAAGIVLFILVCMSVISDEPIFRSAAFVVALACAGFAAYDLIRILQKISEQPGGFGHANIAWGLIVTVIAAIGSLIAATNDTRRA